MSTITYDRCTITYDVDKANGVCSNAVSEDIIKFTGAGELIVIKDVSADTNLCTKEECRSVEYETLKSFCESFSDKLIVFVGGDSKVSKINAKLAATLEMYFYDTEFRNISYLTGGPGEIVYLYMNELGFELHTRLQLAAAGGQMRSLLKEYDEDGTRALCFTSIFANDVETVDAIFDIISALYDEVHSQKEDSMAIAAF